MFPRRFLGVLAVVGFVAIACGGSQPTLHGRLHLSTSDGVFHSGNKCHGTGGYDDLQQGASVTVKNEAGSIIATTSLDDGVSDPAYPTVACDFSFVVPNVPDAKFYTVEVSHRGALTYSKDQLTANGWKVEASIGS